MRTLVDWREVTPVACEALGLPNGQPVALDLESWYHLQKLGEIMDVYVSGDVAPDARLNFRYSTAAAP
jgi:hypothetical protein